MQVEFFALDGGSVDGVVQVLMHKCLDRLIDGEKRLRKEAEIILIVGCVAATPTDEMLVHLEESLGDDAAIAEETSI